MAGEAPKVWLPESATSASCNFDHALAADVVAGVGGGQRLAVVLLAALAVTVTGRLAISSVPIVSSSMK